MSVWGTGIYQNDVGDDVRIDYVSKLKAGKSDTEALQEMLSEYVNESNDTDCSVDFYLALADVQWKKGRLTDEIKKKALMCIEKDRKDDRWQESSKQRSKVLDKLELQLNSVMPERKKISIKKPYKLDWKEKQVYAFALENETGENDIFKGCYAMFYIDRIKESDWQVKGVFDDIAELYFYVVNKRPNDVNIIESVDPVCFLNVNEYRQYRVDFHETSKRLRPKDLFLVGEYNGFKHPENEMWNNRFMDWGLHERDIVIAAEKNGMR